MEKTQNLSSALDYISRGWPVFPVYTPTESGCSCGKKECSSIGKHPMTPRGVKDATTDEEQVKSWWNKWPEANIGLATGKESGLVVLDIDVKYNGDQSLKAIEDEHGPLPDTPYVSTGGGGRHIIFKHPGKAVKNQRGLKPGIDVRGDGGYIIAPPSLHVSGSRYQWAKPIEEVAIQEIPEWLLTLLITGPKSSSSSTGSIHEGGRNDYLFRYASSMRGRGFGRDDITDALLLENLERCIPPLPEKEVLRIVQSVMNYEPGPSFQMGRRRSLSELGNAERLIDLHGENIRYNQTRQKWFYWDGKRWALDSKDMIYKLAKDTVKGIYGEASACDDDNFRKKLAHHAVVSETAQRIKAMVELAKSEVSVTGEEFDSDLWKLNVLNGTIDLRTGELSPHFRGDLITKMAPVKYEPDAECPIWLSTLDKIMKGNQELINFLKSVVGYSLTGDTGEQVMFFLYGTGANGKSTFLDAIGDMLGDYAQQTPADTLMMKRSSGVNNDIARLRGARFVSAVEAEEGKRLAESLIKQITGGDKIAARFLFGEWFEFKPEFKIFLATNHKPVIKGTDYGIWRRIRLIPFEVTIPKEEIDKSVPEKLRQELSGILRWAIEGCLEWQREGLGNPTEVIAATDGYKGEMDTLADFIAECCEVDPEEFVRNQDLYSAYTQWCNSTGERPLSQKALAPKLKERGFIPMRTNKARGWKGLVLKDDEGVSEETSLSISFDVDDNSDF